MIDPATGMKAGECYGVENVERAHPFTGFFLDGKYYLGPELLTAVGWLEGKRFIYDHLDAAGEPVFPDRVAGEIDDLKLTLPDGTGLKLSTMQVSAMVDEREAIGLATAQHGLEAIGITRTDRIPLLLSAAVVGFVAGFIITRGRQRRR